MDFNAAIFDLDGTILDSMDVWEHIDIQFLKKRNLPVPENYVTEICARSFEEAAQYTIDLFGLQETVEGIIEEWNNMAVEEYSNHVGLLPHALDYLLRLKEHGIKLAVATGLPEKLYIPLRPVISSSGCFRSITPGLSLSATILTPSISKEIPEGLMLPLSILSASATAVICP